KALSLRDHPDIIRMNREAKQSLPQKGSAINDRLPRRFASRKDKLCHNIYCVCISTYHRC
ncbi:MAG: hypothetical protein Q8O43_09095, partial [Dehalococcoidia bacterium]|nr:hypothetical protein [Dehalococcoidia bacterium]